MRVHLLMYLNAIVNAHLFNMFRQAKHLYCVIYTLRPRYISNTVMPEIMLHTLYVIKLFFPQVLYIQKKLYVVFIRQAKTVLVLISNIAVFIFRHNCLFNCTSFFSPQRDYSFKTTCCKNLVEEITTVYDMPQLNGRIGTLFQRNLGQLIKPVYQLSKMSKQNSISDNVFQWKNKAKLPDLKVV